MIYVFFFVIQIVVLYITAKKIASLLLSSTSGLRFVKVRYWLFSIFFIPGTFIHELSHLMMAVLLGVNVKSFSLLPVFKDSKIILGSVEILDTGFVRRFLIGVAPLIFGVGFLIIIVYLFITNKDSFPVWAYGVFTFFVFVISNTMFLSDKDLEGSWKFYIFVLILLIIFYAIFQWLNISFDINYAIPFFTEVTYLLCYPLAINLLFLLLVKGLLS